MLYAELVGFRLIVLANRLSCDNAFSQTLCVGCAPPGKKAGWRSDAARSCGGGKNWSRWLWHVGGPKGARPMINSFIIVQHLPSISGSLPEPSWGPPRHWRRLAGAQRVFFSLRLDCLAVHMPDAIAEQGARQFRSLQHTAMSLSRMTKDSRSVQ